MTDKDTGQRNTKASITGVKSGKFPKQLNLRSKAMRNDKECEGCSDLTVSQTDPVLFLPTLPMKRAKPVWMIDQPSFCLPGTGELPPDKPAPLKQWYNPDGVGCLPSIDEKRKAVQMRKNIEQGKASLKESRKRQEAFRRSLLTIVMQGKSGPPAGPIESMDEDVPAADIGASLATSEADLFRYFYYIHNGVDTGDVKPMSNEVIERILGRLNETLKRGQGHFLEKLCDEIKDDYLLNTKKSILDFVLKDPRQMNEVNKYPNAEMAELDVVPQPWHNSLIGYKKKLHQTLCFVNPCIRQATEIWFSDFDELRFIDCMEFQTRRTPIDIHAFTDTCTQSIMSVKEMLTKSWLIKLQQMLLSEKNMRYVPPEEKQDKFERFFETLKTAMTLNLQQMIISSLMDYTHMFKPLPTSTAMYEHCGFLINLDLDDYGINFDPTFDVLRNTLIGMFDDIIKASQSIPRLERRMFPEMEIKAKYLLPAIPDEFVEDLKEIVVSVLKHESGPLQDYLVVFDEFEFLITNNARDELSEFLATSHTFDELTDKFKFYQELAQHIEADLPRSVTVGMFELQCDGMIDALHERALQICEALVEEILEDHIARNKEVCARYKELTDVALTVPMTTNDYMKLESFMKKTKQETLADLQLELVQSNKRLTFLCDNSTFNASTMRSNAEPFLWYQNMDSVFEENALIMSEKLNELQDELKVKKIKFIGELEEYTRQVDELELYSDFSQIENYNISTINLQEKLIGAADTIARLNEEEEAYGFDVSQYPQRTAAIKKMTPFATLFRECAQFNENYKKWMNGPMVEVLPDEVEGSVGASYRAIFKLEKSFQKKPRAEAIAAHFRERVEEFKHHLPLIGVLFNPGLRARHWEQISDISGYSTFILLFRSRANS